MEYKRDEPKVPLLVDHLLWCPKRRLPVLKGPVAAHFETISRQVGETYPAEILQLPVNPDLDHLFLRAFLTNSRLK